MTAEERRVRQADQLEMIRLRMMIRQALDNHGITTPAGIGAAVGLPGSDALKMLSRRQWRGGDRAQLEAMAARLGLEGPT